MIPCIACTIGGVQYYPLYNNNAMFRLQDLFPDGWVDKINGASRGSVELSLDVFSILCDEGRAVRKRYGYADMPIDLDDLKFACLPADIITIKNAIFAAVTIGTTREVPDLEDTDLTLLELQKKTK